MAGQGNKRKRPSDSDQSRPSPYRPQDQADYSPQYSSNRNSPANNNSNYRGNRRQIRGNRGGAGPRGGSGPRFDAKNARSPTNPQSPIEAQSLDSSLQQDSSKKAMSPTSSAPTQASINSTSNILGPSRELNVPAPVSSTQISAENQSPPEPYGWEVITDELLEAWETKGKQQVIAASIEARHDALLFGNIIQEAIRAGLDRRLPAVEVGDALKEMLQIDAVTSELETQVKEVNGKAEDTDDMETAVTKERNHENGIKDEPPSGVIKLWAFDRQALFLDIIAGLGDSDVDNSALKTILTRTNISPALMRRYLETQMLEKLGLIRSTFARIGIRKTTNLLYRQSNYNLLREETEGYSKLITELFTTSNNNPPSSEVVEETFQRVLALIGAFDLDVGRALDVTLDVFAAVLVKQYRFFVKLLRASSWWPKSQSTDGLHVLDQGFSSLPSWAMPGSSAWTTKDEERESIDQMKNARDEAFWNRVRQVGIAAFFEIGGRRVLESEEDAGSSVEAEATDEGKRWVNITHTLPPSGSRVAAQVLGFKLRFYASEIRDANDILPDNLIYLAALLIKIGFISLRDLYEHLYPADDGMETVKEQKMKEKAEREAAKRYGSGAPNALLMASALPDDTRPLVPGTAFQPMLYKTSAPEKAAETSAKDKTQLLTPADQKVSLLRSLLCIGAIPEALYILTRFPWLIDAYPDLIDHVHRILHHCLSRVYEPLRPLQTERDLFSSKRRAEPGVSKGQIRHSALPPRRVLRWAQIDRKDADGGTDYKFYWDDWADNVPVCHSASDVISLCTTFLKISGVKIGKDSTLLVKIARIGRQHLADDPSDANKSRWVDLSTRLIVPALSLTEKSPGVVNEVWELIRGFPMTTRFSIYAEWYFGSVSRIPDIKTAFDQVRSESKDVLKRISTTTVKPMARALAKAAHSSPGIVFNTAFNQMESYDNLTETFVECARYLTDLAYDVLVWSLMNSLGGSGRSRLQADGMLTSKWLRVLSDFAGKLFKRYSVITCTPILQYVAEQLRRSNSTDLVVLSEMISAMGGILTQENLSEEHILCLAGGDQLRRRVHLELRDKRYESKATSRRLTKALVESNLAGQLLVSIGQLRQTCIFNFPDDAHLKVLGNILDEVHGILIKYLELLWGNISKKELQLLIPSVTELVNDFGLEPKIAFLICRPTIAMAIQEVERNVLRSGDGDVVMQNDQASSKISTSPSAGAGSPKKDQSTPPSDAMDTGDAENAEQPETIEAISSRKGDSATSDIDMVMENSSKRDQTLPSSTSTRAQTPALGDSEPVQEDQEKSEQEIRNQGKEIEESRNPVLQEIMENLQEMRTETGGKISTSFYVAFWQAALYDIWQPDKTYLGVVTKIRREWTLVNSDNSLSGRDYRESQKKQLDELSSALQAEMKDQHNQYTTARDRLIKEKSTWFTGFHGQHDQLHTFLLEECFIPRLTLSPIDAVFAFRMLKFLHSNNTPNFRTVGLIDQLFRDQRMVNIIFVCTSREAENLGVFLKEVLEDLAKWHASRTTYESEAWGSKKDLVGFTRAGSPLSYENFRHLLYKWHRNLHAALQTCLSGGEYMHVRNALFIMKAIQKSFPAVDWIGQKSLESLQKLADSEDREDLKLVARSLFGAIKPRSSTWLQHHQFRESDVTNPTRSPSRQTRSDSSRPKSPQPDSEVAKKLNAGAPEFKPSESKSLHPPSEPSSRKVVSKGDAEDGELNDQNSLGAKPVNAQGVVNGQNTVGKGDSKDSESTLIRASQADTRETPKFNADASRSNNSQRKVDDSSLSSRPYSNRVNSSTDNYGKPYNNFGGSRADAQPTRYPENRQPPMSGARPPRDYHPHETGRMDPAGAPRDVHRDHRAPSPRRAPDGPSNRQQWEREPPVWNDSRGPNTRNGYDDPHGRPGSRDERVGSRGAAEWNERGPLERYPARDGPPGGRTPPYQSRPPRDSSMGMPRSSGPINMNHHSERPLMPQGDVQHDLMRRERDEPRSRPSRPPSPPRHDSSRQSGPSRPPTYADERILHNDRPSLPRSRQDDLPPPTGPRGDRPLRSGPDTSSSERGRELFAPSSQPQRPVDPEHGRLSREPRQSSRQQDPNYGRLNPVQDAPAGPRGGRNITAPANNRRMNESVAPPTDAPSAPETRQAPAARQSARTTRRNGPNQTDQPPSGPSSAPPTPASETSASDPTKIHPDRLRGIEGSSEGSQKGGLPPINTAQRQSTRHSQAPSPAMAAPPSGPRNANQPSQNPISPQGPPYNQGRAGTNDRRRGGGERKFQDVKDLLQSSGSERPERGGGNIRGRGGRSNGYSVPHSPTVGAPGPNMNRQGPADQPEYNQSTTQRGEENVLSQNDGSRENGRERRSERHRSRSRSPHHGSGRREEDRSSRRDDQGSRRGSVRDDRDSRRSRDDGRERKDARDVSKGHGPPAEGSASTPGWEGESRGSSRRRDNRDEKDSARDGGGSGRKRGPMGEETSSERGHREVKRTRR